MSFFSKVVDFFSGGMGDKIVNTVKDYFPPDMSEKERAQLENAIRQSARDHELKLTALAQEETAKFNQRIKEMEGTTKDLKQFGWIGSIVIFLRGLQRPFWGFGTFYLDIVWLFGTNTFSEKQELALVLINVLVLGFLFGERAMKNVAPLLARIAEAKK